MPEEDFDFKSTLLLPNTEFPMRASLPKREPEWIEHWNRLEIYKKLRTLSASRKPFVLHDGPPYANGHLHIGHALNKILKDFIVRSHQMLGFDSRYVPGWDCHGLPIEWKIEEEFRKEGRNKDNVPINDLRKKCRDFAEEWVNVQRKEFCRLGITGDWQNPYKTMDFHAEARIASEFMKFIANGSVYQGSKPVMWSPVEKTALAEAEIEYKEHESKTVWVKFPVSFPKNCEVSIVIWTTTPWTLPSNRAISFNKKISYSLYEIKQTEEECWMSVGEKIMLADKLAEDSLKKARVISFEKVKNVKVDELEQIKVKHPFAYTTGSDGFWDYDIPIIESSFVTEEVGTGFVHMAPSHGAEDYEEFVKRGWTDQLTHNVEEDSSFSEKVPFFGGLEIFNKKGKEAKGNEAIIQKLIEVGALMARGRLKHSYPHSWRSKAPIIFRNTNQWFVSIDKKLPKGNSKYGTTIRGRALKSIDQLVQWVPKSGRNRLYSMIETRPDWVLSRQRVWGVPLTCFIRKNKKPSDHDFVLYDEKVNNRIIEAFEKKGADVWFEINAKERFLDGLYDPNDFIKINDILDVWFDSGSTHSFVLKDRADGKWPADLYLEGTDQHRGWFHSSLLQACGTEGRAPYSSVLTHGFTLDENGMKMSKSLGNTVSPEEVIRQYGADILRLWVAQSDYTTDLRIGPEILKGVADSYRRLRNTMRFMLGSLGQSQEVTLVRFSDLPELEKWLLHRLKRLDALVRKGYETYSFQNVFQHLFQFCTVDLSSFYFDIRKDALYCDPVDSPVRSACIYTIDLVYKRLVTWLAPILPFTMEEVWLSRFQEEEVSIHLEDFPETPASWLDDELEQKWEVIRNVRSLVTAAIEIERQEKNIGSSLEASVIINFKDTHIMQIVESVDLSEICITSDMEIKLCDELPVGIDPYGDSLAKVEIVKAKGNKCNRCWKYSQTCSEVFGKPLCPRCALVLDNM
ncbi:MAG: isoleucine--tRNA ligase [Paracoccaceae bacterium]